MEGTMQGEQPNPDGRLIWQTWSVIDQSKGRVAAVNVVPAEEFVHIADAKGECICGPWTVEFVQPDGEDTIPHLRHWPLDARYYDQEIREAGDGE